MAEKKDPKQKIVADNRKARFHYEIGEVVEAGIMLTGTEVKALRQGRATIAESYADTKRGELWLINANIPEYLQGGRDNHEPKRPRKLLLHKMYFNERGRAKVEVAVAKGKKLHDKRETDKKRDWNREKSRLMRVKG